MAVADVTVSLDVITPLAGTRFAGDDEIVAAKVEVLERHRHQSRSGPVQRGAD